MTNAELYTKMEELAMRTIILLRDCNCDISKIDNALWLHLCETYKEVQEYI